MTTRSPLTLSLLAWLLAACSDVEPFGRDHAAAASPSSDPASCSSIPAPPVEPNPELDLEQHLDRLEREITAP